ncbi:MAG: hypothetical protein M3N30_07425 [Bacteroidota bacterium]|nr:hypothetical protein [Bacteroidota bacterium]
MKKRSWQFFDISLFSFITAFLFSGCMKDKITRTYKISTPVYEVLTKFREGIKSGQPVAVSSPGKITIAGKYIYLSEPYKGIHIIDNSNPSNPKNVSFINIHGNEDIAITGNTLYADAYGDLVSFDISDPLNVVAKNFATNIFPDHSIYYFRGYNQGSLVNPDSINVLVGWTTRDTTVNYNPGDYIYPVSYFNCYNCMVATPSASVAANAAASNKTGTNGSMARFSIIKNFLYTVGYSDLTAFDISDPLKPVFASSVQVDFHVETIYPLKDRLFVGTNNGMYMYNVQATPSTPALIGQFTHVRGCDPVIADDNYAYITINDSSACLGSSNELQIIDIKDFANSYMVTSYQLTHPVGLSKDGNKLFVCDGKEGLKIYDASDVTKLKLIRQLHDSEVYDVISENGLAIVVAKNGIYQYDYSDAGNIHLVSKL